MYVFCPCSHFHPKRNQPAQHKELLLQTQLIAEINSEARPSTLKIMKKTLKNTHQSVTKTLSIRLNLGPNGIRIGPGKVSLLEQVGETGSIAAAGRTLNMSYRRAWLLIDSLNQAFVEPVVIRRSGGSGGGGAELTDLGREIISRYRCIERTADATASEDLAFLSHLCREDIQAK